MIINDDCLAAMCRINDGSVDMILCDLPYGTTACKWDTVIPLEPLWAHYKRVIKPNGAIVLFGSQPFSSKLGASNIGMLKYSWVWEKSRATGHLNAKKMPMKSVEDILVYYKNKPTFNPQGLVSVQKTMINSKSDSLRSRENATSTVSGGIKHIEYVQHFTSYPRQVLRFKSEGAPVHSTQKPVALCEYLIRTYTNEGETVLDNCMGSGTTGIAAMNAGRKFIGIEKDQKYFEIARNRIDGHEKKAAHDK